MKKEKIIKAHTRRTKSGKIVTVRQHTAKYDAADEAKKLAKKIGAGDELETLKKRGKYEVLGIDLSKMSNEDFKEFASGFMDENDKPAPKTRGAFKKWVENQNWGSEGAANFREGVAEYMKSGGAKGIVSSKKDKVSKVSAPKSKPSKTSTTKMGTSTSSKKAIEKTPKYTATSDLYDKKTHSEFLKKLRNKYDISKVFTDKRKKWRTVTIYGYGNNSRPFRGKEEEVKKAISRQYPGAKIQKIDKKYYLSGFRVYLPHKKDN